MAVQTEDGAKHPTSALGLSFGSRQHVGTLVAASRLTEIHQLPYGMVIENLHAHVLLKFLDRDFAREAVIGAIEANDLGEQSLSQWHFLPENGLQNCLLPLEGHDIARITISVGIARD